MYAGNTRTCFPKCARGAGIDGDVLNGHTEGRAVSSSVLLTKICPRRVITWPQRSTKETNGSHPFSVRGALLTKESDSSFAEAHREFLSELTHKEGEDEDQEDEVEDGRDCEECKVEIRREVRHISA